MTRSFMMGTLAVVLVIAGSRVGSLVATAAAQDQPLAPVLDNLGALHHEITTSSERAQRFFDQGLRMTYGFNHAEAIRSFREAARLDPDAPMPYWGQALALGPNINDPMRFERELQAYEAIQQAIARKANGSPAEQAYIDALATRYSNQDSRDRHALDQAYADAVHSLWAEYPDDGDAGTLYAAALMNQMPWNYWNADGTPRAGTPNVIRTLERVIEIAPNHPGARHYYIHIVEASSDPDRAVASADVLESLMPGAGHLVHMPAHIYLRVGRYAEASESNVRAIAADESYIAACQAQGLYPVSYYPHNIHFLWASSNFEGRKQVSIDSAHKLTFKTPRDMLHAYTALQDFIVTPLYSFVRFRLWNEILTDPKPESDLVFPNAIWRYARARAFTERGELDDAASEVAALRELLTDETLERIVIRNNQASRIVQIALQVADGELAIKQGRTSHGIESLENAVALQDALLYAEPAAWHYPVRHTLGAALLDLNRAAQAESVYRTDLEQHRHNGWALYGLMQSLEAQDKTTEAAAVKIAFQKAWVRADYELTSSRY